MVFREDVDCPQILLWSSHLGWVPHVPTEGAEVADSQVEAVINVLSKGWQEGVVDGDVPLLRIDDEQHPIGMIL